MATFPQTGETFGPYKITSRLGQGGMGVVFRAIQTTLNREVALKVLPPQHAEVEEFRNRFTREAGLLAAMNSPHIIAIHDFGELNGCLFIATQLVPGGDLAARLAQSGPLPIPLALTVAEQVASALSAAHRSGVVHRDVKPTNVLLGERDGEPHAYLCDFGIARSDEDGITQAGTVVGTYGYLAPERMLGNEATPASDIYSLGCLLVAAITGEAPYRGTDAQVTQQHLSSAIPQWEETTPLLARLNHLLRRSMAKEPGARYADAQEFRRDLLAVSAELQGAAQPAIPAQRTEQRVAQAEDRTAYRPVPVAQPAQPAQPAPLASAPSPSPSRRNGVLYAVLGSAVALVAIIVGLVLVLDNKDKADPVAAPSTPTARVTTVSNPTPDAGPRTPTKPATRICNEGRRVRVDKPCGTPRGVRGLHWIFPNVAGAGCDAAVVDPGRFPQKLVVQQCNEAGGALVTYSAYSSYRVNQRHNIEWCRGCAPSTVRGGFLQWGPFRLPGGRYKVARMYDDGKHAFGFSVLSRSASTSLARAARIQMRPLSDFDD